MYGIECHEHIVWWVFAIDTHSVLSGSGKGDFAGSMLRNGALSPWVHHGQASDSRRSCVREPSDNDPGRYVLECHRTILTLAAQLGFLARDLRADYAQPYRLQGQARSMEALRRQNRVMQLRDTLRRTWDAQSPSLVAMGYSNESLPMEARGIFEHVRKAF